MPFPADAFQEPVTRQPMINAADPSATAIETAPIAVMNLFAMLFSTPVAVGTLWIKQPRTRAVSGPSLPNVIRRLV